MAAHNHKFLEEMDNSLLGKRNGAIDMLRGVTMFLMVTVNEFWTVHNVPHWLCHTDTFEDGMGLSDIVFPMFLFAMGMSIPYALERRFSKGLSGESTIGHILSRTFALIVMGVFTMNAGGDFAPLLGYGKAAFWILMITGFFLVWNKYPEEFRYKNALRWCGATVLLFLAVTFRSGDGWYMHAGWWGILGLIGWAYLFCATTYLLCRRKTWIIPLLWAGLMTLNILTTGLRDGSQIIEGDNIIANFADALHLGNGSCSLMAMGGMLLSLCDLRARKSSESRQILFGCCTAAALFLSGLLAHQWWITSKNIGTLPWCLYTSALSVAFYTLLRVLEKHGLTHWFAPFRPAGTATLSVYMMPYIGLALWVTISPSTPEWLSGGIGVLKCAIYSLACIWLAELLGKINIRLKI